MMKNSECSSSTCFQALVSRCSLFEVVCVSPLLSALEGPRPNRTAQMEISCLPDLSEANIWIQASTSSSRFGIRYFEERTVISLLRKQHHIASWLTPRHSLTYSALTVTGEKDPLRNTSLSIWP